MPGKVTKAQPIRTPEGKYFLKRRKNRSITILIMEGSKNQVDQIQFLWLVTSHPLITVVFLGDVSGLISLLRNHLLLLKKEPRFSSKSQQVPPSIQKPCHPERRPLPTSLNSTFSRNSTSFPNFFHFLCFCLDVPLPPLWAKAGYQGYKEAAWDPKCRMKPTLHTADSLETWG